MCNYSSANNKDNDEPETTNIEQEIAFYEQGIKPMILVSIGKIIVKNYPY